MNKIDKFFIEQFETSSPLTTLQLNDLKSKKDIFGNEILVGDIILFCLVDIGEEYQLVSIIERLFNDDNIDKFNEVFDFVRRDSIIPLFKTKTIKLEYRKYLEG